MCTRMIYALSSKKTSNWLYIYIFIYVHVYQFAPRNINILQLFATYLNILIYLFFKNFFLLMYHGTNVLCCKETSLQKKKNSNSKVRGKM